jgi:hypothetical protein
MAYNEKSLEGAARTLKSKAVFSVIGWVLFGLLAAGVYHKLTLPSEMLHPNFSRAVYDQQASGEAIIFGLLAFVVGLFRCQKYIVEANMMLCAVEQEKHLRLIAGYLRDGHDNKLDQRPLGQRDGWHREPAG